MKKVLAIGCLSLLGLGLLVAGLLFFLALRAEPLPTTIEALATVPDSERKALESICGLAGIEAASIRNIASYEGGIFDHDLNRQSLVVRNGHIIALCLRKTPFTGSPDFTALVALEALDLRGGNLAEWPDLSPLAALRQADLSEQAQLGDPGPGKLPPNLERLNLADTKIADTPPLASLTKLKSLDLSSTPVTTFAPLLGLALDQLSLASCKIESLPDTVPTAGAWELDLEGTPVVNPPGYSREWPFEGWITSTTNKADQTTGVVGRDKVEVTGNAAPTDQPRAVKLPRCNDPKAPPVRLEIKCTAGNARIWLEEPPDFFPSPWMKQGKVKGFGLMRKRGYLSATLKPGETVTLRGSLFLTTHDRLYEMAPENRSEARKPPDWCDYSFYLEPLDGNTVSGLEFKVTGP